MEHKIHTQIGICSEIINQAREMSDINKAIEWASKIFGKDIESIESMVRDGLIKENNLIASYKKSLELEADVKRILEE